MAIWVELKSSALLLIGAILGAGLHSAYVAERSQKAPGFLEVDDPPVDSPLEGFLEVDGPPVDGSLLGGAMDGTSARRLGDVNDVPFIQNATNTRCAKGGDRLFTKSKMDLPECYAECSNTPRCNYFGFAFTGPVKGWCNGCEIWVSDYRDDMILFTMVRNKETFSCPDGQHTDFHLDALVGGGDRPYQLCIYQVAGEDPKCFSFRTGLTQGSNESLVRLCAQNSSSTSSSTTTSTTLSSESSTTSSASSSTSTSTTPSSESSTTSSSSSSSSSSTSTSTAGYVFEPANRTELKEAVDKWVTNKTAAMEEYGDISSWSTSLVTDMSRLFLVNPGMFWEALDEDGEVIVPGFNDDISGWDVSQVTNMAYMFSEAWSFNQDLSAWNVSNVETMEGMFLWALSFNQSLSSWDVSNVKRMSWMFAEARSFNGDISSWSVGNVVTMSSMFAGARTFNQDISGWNVGMVRWMAFMFSGLKSFNQDLSQWDVSSAQSMSGMFQGCAAFSQNIASWDVSYVIWMHNMFDGASSFLNVDVSVWNPVSLRHSPKRFISAASVACTHGDWSHWGSKTPQCYLY